MKLKCLIVDDEPLAHEVIANFALSLQSIEVIGNCYNAFEAIDFLNETTLDLIFLDINMPKLKGLQFLRTLAHPPLIIVTTAYQEYAIESFELEVCDYLLKPYSFERFIKAVNRAVEFKKMKNKPVPPPSETTPVVEQTNTAQESVFLKSDKKVYQVYYQDILYLESLGSYVKFHLKDQVIITLERLSNYEKSLPPSLFVRVHKSYIVNIKKIQVIEGNTVKINQLDLPIGSVYKSNLKKIIGG
ncbi:MAG TPA: DNA-binding response regulator [Microscillaceae bacterium]|nr:DNA-binding response regulator [Microscillaceae bacterium]